MCTIATLMIDLKRSMEPLKENEPVRMNIVEAGSIPAGANPFHYDLVSMGSDLTDNIMAMYESRKPTTQLDLYVRDTGQKFTVIISPAKPTPRKVIGIADKTMSLHGAIYRHVIPKVGLGTSLFVPVTSGNIMDNGTAIIEHRPELGRDFYIAVHNRVLVSVDALLTNTLEEITDLISEEVLDDDLAQRIVFSLSEIAHAVSKLPYFGGTK